MTRGDVGWRVAPATRWTPRPRLQSLLVACTAVSAAILAGGPGDAQEFQWQSGGSWKDKYSPYRAATEVKLALAKETRALELLDGTELGDREALKTIFATVKGGYVYLRGAEQRLRGAMHLEKYNPLLKIHADQIWAIRKELVVCMTELDGALSGGERALLSARRRLREIVARIEVLGAGMGF